MFCPSGWDDQHLVPYVFWSLHGVPEDLARSLGKDATLNDILQMLDEPYGMVMTFKTLSKEFYSLKQGSRENVAELRVHLSQQLRVSGKDPTGEHRGDEVKSLLGRHEPQIPMNAGPKC